MKRLYKFLMLSASEQVMICQAFGVLTLIRLGLWLVPFRWLHAWTQRAVVRLKRLKQRSVGSEVDSVGDGPSDRLSAVAIAQVISAVEIATHYSLGRPKCLARALSAQLLLQRYGYNSNLRIGVMKNEQNELAAHAWLEISGEVVIGRLADLSSFTRLPDLVEPPILNRA